jgi:hypothetical protein
LGVRVRRSTNICSHRHRIESGDTAGADRFPARALPRRAVRSA